MKSGTINHFLYTNQTIESDPVAFDKNVILFLRDEYRKSINNISLKLSEEIPICLLDKYQAKFERHLFPALLIAKSLDIGMHFVEDFCVRFVKGFSIPIMALDKWLDTDSEIDRSELLQTFGLIYNANSSFNGDEQACILALINNKYFFATKSAKQELTDKFVFPEEQSLNKYVKMILVEQKYYRTNCYYFATIIEGILRLGRAKINANLHCLLAYFGLLRQVADEIVDVEEDLSKGIVTLPVLYSLEKNNIKNDIKRFWEKQIPFQNIRLHILESLGFEKTYRLGFSIYKKCKELKSILQNEYKFIDQLFLFYDLKLCLLYRLKRNHFKDERINYS